MSSTPRVPAPEELRLRAVLRSYAAGDAFGVGYEFLDEALAVDISRLRSRDGDEDWALGAVSDDTLLTLLTVGALRAGTPQAAREAFLSELHARVALLRGLGPTTRAALGMPVPDDQLPLVGRTNGALMRTAVVGLAYRGTSPRRRPMVIELARATHSAPAAVECAALGAALLAGCFDDPASGAIEILEAEWTRSPDVPSFDLVRILEWVPGSGGVSLDPIDTLGAVVWIAEQRLDVAGSFVAACSLGGDTDTVAALAGAIAAARDLEARGPDDLDWVDQVGWAEIAELDDRVRLLAEMRGAA